MMQCVIESLGVMVISAVIDPWLILPAIVLVAFSIPLREIYLRTGRDVKRLESIVRSPIYSHISTTFDGLTTIRAFGLENQFTNQYYRYMRDSTSTLFLSMATARAIAFALDFLSLLYVASVNIFIIYSNGLEGGVVGLVLSNATLLIGLFQFAIQSSAEFETQMISVERVLEYGRLPSEPPLEFPTAKRPWMKTWPSSGTVEYRNVSLTYGKGKDAKEVLKNISFNIADGEKVGIVGRTGAGKSSMISVLFRLVEPDGTITIDEIDTKTLGLHELRGKISIIPQDPVLFSGSVRDNLDPFREYSDEVLWSCLRSADLEETVLAMDGGHGLDGTIREGGSNLSVGQRQLMCLARALLKQNRILVLDEATANVDMVTDELIQKTIKSNFSHCTVLTIAHRLNTIIDMDKVLVLDAGKVMEFDSPHVLLSKPRIEDGSGLFKDMVNQTGKEVSEMLHKIAEETFHSRLKNQPEVEKRSESDFGVGVRHRIQRSEYTLELSSGSESE